MVFGSDTQLGDRGLSGGPLNLMRLLANLERRVERESDRLFLWLPVVFGLGIACYFALTEEPGWPIVGAALLTGIALKILLRRPLVAALVATMLLSGAIGATLAKTRTLFVSAPVLAKKMGPVTITGWIEQLERRVAKKGDRLVLRITRVERLKADQQLYRVRIVVRMGIGGLNVGQTIRLRAILMPPPDPVMPGGFDFARKAFFASLGAVGFAVTKPEIVSPQSAASIMHRMRAWIGGLRQRVALRIREVLPGDTGALVVALITGQRGEIPQDMVDALRHSGLAHVLAISGMHMAMMAGALFWLVRLLMATSQYMALHWPIKKIAAMIAMGGAAFYLLLSGGALATQRAFVMIMILFLAVLVDRPALTLRNVAVAALVILVLYPESLLDVSFQMSFAAVTALVAVYEALANRSRDNVTGTFSRRIRQVGRYIGGLALTTVVAGLAVAPFAAYHFHHLSAYSFGRQSSSDAGYRTGGHANGAGRISCDACGVGNPAVDGHGVGHGYCHCCSALGLAMAGCGCAGATIWCGGLSADDGRWFVAVFVARTVAGGRVARNRGEFTARTEWRMA